MARGDFVIALSEQIAQLINDCYGTPWKKITVVPYSVDFDRFNPDSVTCERVEEMRAAWGVKRETKVILITGRILRRKGYHVVVKAKNPNDSRKWGRTNFCAFLSARTIRYTASCGTLCWRQEP